MKKRLLLVSIVIYLLPSLGISQVIDWQNTIGGNGIDQLQSIEQTSDGGYILGGYSNSDISGDKTENSIGLYDFWIIKTDSWGTIQWQNTIGGTSDDALTTIQQTADGGYILGGWSNSDISGDKTEMSHGGWDYWIVKTDASGIIQWQNTIGGSEDDNLESVRQTTDGGYILGGFSESNVSGDKSENCMGSIDYWIVKIDSTGLVQWQNTIGGNDYDILLSVGQTSDGGYILAGSSASDISGDKSENNIGNKDYWIIKTDNSGLIQWQNTIGGSGNDNLGSIIQTMDGGYFLGGNSDSNISGDKTENSQGNTDYWVIKTDDSGNLQWQNTIGGIDTDQGTSVDQTPGGDYIIGGYSLSNISGNKSENRYGANDYWILKLDSAGNIKWQNTLGGNSFDELSSIVQTDDGSYFLGGNSQSDIWGDKSEDCNGQKDYWIIKIIDQYNLITGKLFIDSNSNNLIDTGESYVKNKQVVENNTLRFSFSEQNGNFSVNVLGTGSFYVSPMAINYYNTVPISHSSFFTGILQTDSLNDFAFQPVGVFNDLCVAITPLGPFRAGFNANYMITYENVGTTTLSPTVIFFPDDDVSFVSSTPTPGAITIDSLVWNFGPLPPFQSGSILVTVNVNIGTPLGTLINSGAHIEPLAGDANTICNQSYWEVITTGSYDPNDILVDEDTLLTTQFPNPPYLEYTINFQNTGNDTAFAVNILNPIDTLKLEFNTFEIVTSSHPVNLTWIPWEKNMHFQFDNILLPDSNINEPASHGFVRYRIKPKSTLMVGDSIMNNAAIYFDFNAPVITNTAVTHIVLPTSLPEISATYDHLLLYPNPANSMLTIETDILPSSESQLIISDLAGRTLYSKTIRATSTKHNLDISSLSRGIYFVQLQEGERISRGRFVKE